MVLLLYNFRPTVQASAYLQLLPSNTRLSLLRVTVSLSLWEIRSKNHDIPAHNIELNPRLTICQRPTPIRLFILHLVRYNAFGIS
jgi:hypothetical protein